MSNVFSNFAKATLQQAVGGSDTSITVETTTGGVFAAPEGDDYQVVVLTDGEVYEVVHLTSRVGDVLSISREQEDTPARPWAAGTQVLAWNTKGTMEGFLQRSEYQPAVNVQNYRLFR